MINSQLKSYSSLILITISLVAALFFIHESNITRHYAAAERKVSNELNEISHRLTFNLYSNIQSVNSLPIIFSVNPSLSQQDFATATKLILGRNNQLRNISAAPAPDLVIRYMYPREGNEAEIGLDYRTLASQLASVLKVKNERKPILVGPLKLVQGGVEELILRTPVFINDAEDRELFWGIISGIIDVNNLYQESGVFDTALSIEIAIRGKDSLGKPSEVFFGSPELFNQRNVEYNIELPGASWQVVAKPKEGWSVLPKDIWLQRLYLFGIVLLLFVLIVAFLRVPIKIATANDRFRAIFSQSPLGIAVIDSDTGHIYDGNPAYAQITGRSLKQLQKLDWMQITHSDDVQENLNYLVQMNRGKTSGFTMEKRYIQPDGSIRWINMTIVSMKVEDKKQPRHLCMIEDISERKIVEDKLTFMANYDVLTELPNRALFADRFSQAVAHSKRTKSMLAICFLDLDNFKPINDNFGHDTGDKVLVEVANRIKSILREEDTVSRQGGDEFTLLLRDINSFKEYKEMLERVLDALSLPYIINNYSHKITVSIGTTLYPLDHSDLDTLLRHADQAMYQAKLAGKNQQQRFNTFNDQKIANRQSQILELKQALRNVPQFLDS